MKNLAGQCLPSKADCPPFQVPIAVFITSDIGSCGIIRAGVRTHSFLPAPRSEQTEYAPAIHR